MLGATFKLLQTNKEYQEGQSLRQHSAPATQHTSQEAVPASILQHHFVQLLVGYHMLGISVQHVLLDGYFHGGGKLGERSFPFTPFSYTTHSLAGELLTAQIQPDACPYQHFPHRGEEDPGHVQYSGKSHSFPQRDHSTTLIRQQQVRQLSLWRVHVCTHRGIAHMTWSDWCSSDTWPEHIHFGHALEEPTIFNAWRTCAETPRRRGTECPLAIPSMPSAAAPLEVSTTDVMALLQTVRPIAFSLTNLSKPLLQNPPLALL